MPRKKKSEEQTANQQSQQQQNVETIEKKLSDIMMMLNGITTDIKVIQNNNDKLDRILTEIANIYAKIDQLSVEITKIKKMLYHHRLATENKSKKSYSKNYNKTYYKERDNK